MKPETKKTAGATYRDAFEHVSLALGGFRPQVGVVLGSGLGPLADRGEEGVRLPYGEIPGFSATTVTGHSGALVAGVLGRKRVLVCQGRVHAYEGRGWAPVAAPVRLMALLGVDALLLTNAAGAVNPEFEPGDLMLLDDHINLMGGNPLVGDNEEALGPRFPDMCEVYSRRLAAIAEAAARKRKIVLRHGVYLAALGPNYETPAEIRAFRLLGADAVGMSTVPEATVANAAGLLTAGLSCITNMAAGISGPHLSHEEVLAQTRKTLPVMATLLDAFLARLAQTP